MEYRSLDEDAMMRQYRPGRCRIQPAGRGRSADLGPGDLYPAPDSPAVEADFARAEQAARAFAAAHQGRLAPVGRGAGRRHRGVRADRGGAGPADVLRPAAVRRRFHECGDRPLLPDGERAGDRDQQPSALLHAGAEPAGRRGAGAEAAPTRRWRAGGPGCATCACSGRTSSPTSWRSCCTRRR